MTSPLRLDFDVSCPPARAFALWTDRIDTWWPTDHTVTASREVHVTLEPGVGGRIYERTSDGVEHEWGEVTVWEPPNRLGYLWHLRRDRSDATEVSVRFTPSDGQGTRVEIEHTGWEHLGADGETWRDRNELGWQTLLPHYMAAVRADSADDRPKDTQHPTDHEHPTHDKEDQP